MIALGSTEAMVHVCIVAQDGGRVERAWQAHDLECWAVGWATHPDSPMTLYTGADDATLKTWDLRCDAAEVAPTPPRHSRELGRAPTTWRATGALLTQSAPSLAGRCCHGFQPTRARRGRLLHQSQRPATRAPRDRLL